MVWLLLWRYILPSTSSIPLPPIPHTLRPEMQHQTTHALIPYRDSSSSSKRKSSSSSSKHKSSSSSSKHKSSSSSSKRRPTVATIPSSSSTTSKRSRSSSSNSYAKSPKRSLSERLMARLGKPAPVVVDEQASSSRTQSIGLKVVYSAEHPEVDIVAVHGLKGDRINTWTWRGDVDGEPEEVFWLQDLLPKDLEARGIAARVLTFGYNSEPGELLGSVSTNRVHHHAISFVTELYYNRRRSRGVERPIIFLCHSLGGIMVKRALNYSNTCGVGNNEHLRSIKTSTYGILFFGTPHMGADLAAWGTMLESLVRFITPKAVIDTNKELITALGKNSEILQEVNVNFLSIISNFRIFYFWEELRTIMPNGGRQLIVEYASAVPDHYNAQRSGIHATHTEMVKFSGPDVPAYVTVSEAIIMLAEEATGAIRQNWFIEHRNMEIARQDGMAKMIGMGGQRGYHHSGGGVALMRTTDHIAYNPGYPPRSQAMIGHRQFSQGSTTTLPMGGPSNRVPSSLSFGQYPDEVVESDDEAFGPEERRIRQPEPIFMVPMQPNTCFEGRDNELEQLHNHLFNPTKRATGNTFVAIYALPGAGKTHLARQYVYEKRRSFPGGIFWVKAFKTEFILQDFWKIAVALGLKADEAFDPSTDPDRKFISLVLDWFERHEQWLLVLDRSDVETDSEIEALSKYVPKGGKNASVIFTTVNSALVGSARLGSPEGIELKKMDLDAALNMLFKYSLINTRTPRDVIYASELIQRMDYLPLSIHSAGSFIKEKKVTIAAYLAMYKSAPLVQKLTSFHLTLHQLMGRHKEATNLLYLLAFVGPDQIPVNMVRWGIQGDIDWETQLFAEDSEYGGLRSLSNTIGHLLRYSLVDRQSVTCVEGDRTWRVDTLILHRVVQDVCISRMKHNNQDAQPIWVKATAHMFYKSYQYMELRKRGREILVSDYRRYEVHGQCILRHMERITGETDDTVALRDLLKQIGDAIKHYAPIYQQRLDDDTASESSAGSWRPPHSIFRSGSMSESNPATPSPSATRRQYWLSQEGDSDGDKQPEPRESPTDVEESFHYQHHKQQETPPVAISEEDLVPRQHSIPPRPRPGTKTHDSVFAYKRPTLPRSPLQEPLPSESERHIPAIPILGTFQPPTNPGSPMIASGTHMSPFLTQSHPASVWLYSEPDPASQIPILRTPSPLHPSPYAPPPGPPGAAPGGGTGTSPSTPPTIYSSTYPHAQPTQLQLSPSHYIPHLSHGSSGGEVMSRLPSSTISEPIRRTPSPASKNAAPPGFKLEEREFIPFGRRRRASETGGGSGGGGGVGGKEGALGRVKKLEEDIIMGYGGVEMWRSVSAPGSVGGSSTAGGGGGGGGRERGVGLGIWTEEEERGGGRK